MKFILFLICVHFVVIQCAPTQEPDTSIARFDSEPYSGDEGGYNFEYETRDRQIRKEAGVFGRTADGNLILRVSGFYQYLGTDGKNRFIEYEADEHGYRQNVTILMKPSRKRINPNALKSLIG